MALPPRRYRSSSDGGIEGGAAPSGEKIMAQFGIKFALPAAEANVLKREVSVTVKAGKPDKKEEHKVEHKAGEHKAAPAPAKKKEEPEPQVRLYPYPADLTDEWVFETGDEVNVTLVDINNHNERSKPSEPFGFKVPDNIPERKAGGIGVKEKRVIKE